MTLIVPSTHRWYTYVAKYAAKYAFTNTQGHHGMMQPIKKINFGSF